MDGGNAWLLAPVTDGIMRCAFRVANRLGYGVVAQLSEMPLPTRCERAGSALSSRGIVVSYGDVIVAESTADRLDEDKVIVEPKVAGALSDVHITQCRNDLQATAKPTCPLISFGRPRAEIRRVIAQA